MKDVLKIISGPLSEPQSALLVAFFSKFTVEKLKAAKDIIQSLKNPIASKNFFEILQKIFLVRFGSNPSVNLGPQPKAASHIRDSATILHSRPL